MEVFPQGQHQKFVAQDGQQCTSTWQTNLVICKLTWWYWFWRHDRVTKGSCGSGLESQKRRLGEVTDEGASSNVVETSVYCRYQYHEMSAKYNSSCRLESPWTYEKCVLWMAQPETCSCPGPLDPRRLWTAPRCQALNFLQCWSLVLLWSGCDCALVLSHGVRKYVTYFIF